jgi:hypothetical protein
MRLMIIKPNKVKIKKNSLNKFRKIIKLYKFYKSIKVNMLKN